jgi:hypothetical protein
MGAREDALLRFRDACQRDPSVVAAFLGGSIVAHTDDEVSDVDLYAVTQQPEYDQFFSRRHAFMCTWARPSLVVDTLNFEGLGFDMLHFVLDDGVYGELALGHTDNFRVMHGGVYEVLVDKIGLLSGLTFSRHVPTHSDRRNQAERGLNWFWLDYLQFRKQLYRGHSVAAANVLCRLRAHCASLLALADAEKLSLEVAAMNDRLGTSLEATDPARAATALARVHQEVGPPVAAHFGLDYPSEAAELLLTLTVSREPRR